MIVVKPGLDGIGQNIFLVFLDATTCIPAGIGYTARMELDNYDDYDRYDNTLEDLTDEEAIEELMSEGYSEAEARRMLGEYDADDDYTEHDDDIPEMSDFDASDFVDDEDFD